MINHIGFIMDGNRRFAKKNDISKKQAYKFGMEQFLNFVKYQVKYGIYETTFYALSTENWRKRGGEDLKPIGELIEKFFLEGDYIEDFFFENKIKIEIKGDIEELESEAKKNSKIFNSKKHIFEELKQRFDNYNKKLNEIKFKVNICLNYGGQRELVHAFKKIYFKIQNKKLNINDINEDTIKENIYFNDSKSPEILVRPGNAPRLSGFMLWDSAYSEFYFTKKFWPELTEEDFKDILEWFNNIQRNFGK